MKEKVKIKIFVLEMLLKRWQPLFALAVEKKFVQEIVSYLNFNELNMEDERTFTTT